MPSKGLQPGSQDSEVYELVSREASIDLSKGSSTLPSVENDDEQRTSLHRRTRFSQSRSDDEPTGEEVLGLLSRAPLDFPKRFQLSGGLRIALELITQSTPSLLCAVVGSVMTGVVFDQVQ